MIRSSATSSVTSAGRVRGILVQTLLWALLWTMLAAVWPATSGTASAAGQSPPSLPGRPAIPGIGPFGRNADAPSAGTAFNDSRDQVKASLVVSDGRVPAGGDFAIAVVLEIGPGYHVWTAESEVPSGVARFDGAVWTEVKITGTAPGVTVYRQFAQWPKPKLFPADLGDGQRDYAVYEGLATIFLPASVAMDAAEGPRTITASVTFQACADTCLAPVTVELTREIEVVPLGRGDEIGDADTTAFRNFDVGVFNQIRSGAAPPQVIAFDVFGLQFSIDARGAGFLLLLLVAALGGLLLNFTPCVLPVIPIKIMGLANAAGSPGRQILLGATMSLGVIAFWMAIGVAITSVQGFTAVNQLFQYPLFVIGVGVVIAVMALGMMGAFSVGLPQWVYSINPKHESLSGSFFFGIMTAILSTPCTAPLMGAAVAWATTQTRFTVLAVFAAVGLGMALPYAVLSAFPSLTRKMPRTGPASELIKQVMGLLLLAAAAYFIGAGVAGKLVAPPDPPTKLFWWVVAGTGIAAGLWLLIRTVQITPRAGRRLFFGGLGIGIALISTMVGVSQTAKGPIDWVYFTPERFADAKDRGEVVVLDFTAEWCLVCKTLESTVLNLPSVSAQLNSQGVTPIKVDLTGNNEAGNRLLKDVGRVTIPLLVVMSPDGSETFKSDSYTPQQVLDAIERARRSAATPRTAQGGASAPVGGS